MLADEVLSDDIKQSYFDLRMNALGITPEINKIDIWRDGGFQDDGTGIKKSTRVLQPVPIFRPHEKGIEIIVYDVDRIVPQYDNIKIDEKGKETGSRIKKPWAIIRHEKPLVKADGKVMKYQMPSGNGSYPFFPPALLDKYDRKEKIHTLILTEGFFKAFVASLKGVDIVGLPSITHMKNKETGSLHPGILKLIHRCDIKRVVWLTDGDALDLSKSAIDPKEKTDLYKRPASFYSSINTFKQLLDDFDIDKYFFHVDTDGILQQREFMKPAEEKKSREELKGLDDIFVAYPDLAADIVDDINSVSKKGEWFVKFNINAGITSVRKYFRLNNVDDFYLYHVERNTWLKNQEFIFNGTSYKYDDHEGHCKVVIPADAKKYFRVGDSYYKWITRINAYKQLETIFKGRQKTTITDDHGKNFIKHIIKYEDFINVPDHVNYQPSIDGCFNVYNKLDHEPEDEICNESDCPTIISYLRHVFGERIVKFRHPVTGKEHEYTNLDLALDYVQLLYQRPTQKLPILCLVSKENNTGKSTFANLLRLMFSANVAIVGNGDLAGDFNAHWCTKLAVICDETKIDKHAVIEKVKSLSTALKITMNAKGKDQTEIDCFIKFIFITNNEENFIYMTDDDIRYWVNKVPVLTQENPNILDNMAEEIPAFLSFLNSRKLKTEKLNRMWFHPNLLKTEAMKRVIENSMPAIQKELLQHIRDKFFDFGIEELTMTRQAIHKEFFNNRFEANYLERVLKEKLKVDLYHKLDFQDKDLFGNPKRKYLPKRHSYPKWQFDSAKNETVRVDITENGRCYVFKREQFLTTEEILSCQQSTENNYLNSMTAKTDEGLNDLFSDAAGRLPF